MKYIATISFGKDSTVMCDLLLKNGYPVDYIVFTDTLLEFPICKNGYKTRFSDVNSRKSTKCKDCAMNITRKEFLKKDHDLYTHFYNMKSRCNNKNNSHYKTYGERGIKVEWKHFDDFVEDMYDDYKSSLPYINGHISIDRIDNDGNYCKNNCQWISVSENSSKRHKGTKLSDDRRHAMSNQRKGKPQTKARIEAVKISAKNRHKIVVQIQNGEVINTFSSIKEAGIKTKIISQNISEVCRGKRKTAGGYKWMFSKEYLEFAE